MLNKYKQRGFTLIEVLIATIIIAILSSVTIVAFNGVQLRGHMVAASAARDAYVKKLSLYKVKNGRYPIVSTDGATVCLGKSSDYTIRDGFGEGQCRYSNYTSSTASLSSDISSELMEYGSLPEVTWPPASEKYDGVGTDFYRGIFYYSGTLANQGKDAYLWFYISGDATCPEVGYGGYDSETGDTQCTIRLQ